MGSNKASVARDVMESAVVSVSASTPLSSVHRLFVEEGINGAPVVDEQDHVVGVISSTDLMRAAADEHDAVRFDPGYFRNNLEFSGPELSSTPEEYLDRLDERTVGDVMTEEVFSVTPDTPVAKVARELRSHRVHRLVVLENERLVGVITTFDLVGLLEDAGG